MDPDLFQRWYHYLITQWGLSPIFAEQVAAVQSWIQTNGGEAVRITSGYRSPVRQSQLQARWDAGDRRGLVARPADASWHMQGLAVDVSTRSPYFEWFRYGMQYLGNRWGGEFRKYDPVHFDRPIGEPKTIKQLLSG
ncbi:MAG: D-alanyl-D-alanine carboxypeptidase family protein [Candidatus Poribacteria bacterium]|nr:D-alanyl-D-alanine carboxypeptidase family protein [Candidatus Poribacteria bacterium]